MVRAVDKADAMLTLSSALKNQGAIYHLPISACLFETLDRSLWRLLRPSAGQVQQWVRETWSIRVLRIN